MCKEKKSTIKKIPLSLITTVLIISGILKISGIHPMVGHFVNMGLTPALIKVLGTAEIIFSVLFIYPATRKIGLLLLTAYLGGAMAAEIPNHHVTAPLIPLAFVWVAAFLRQPSDFLPATSNNPANLSTVNS
ncbi:MAG TPA: DoxX family protein [Chitinophagaceae bacterium]|nr:DoxX family protein [Chitinophagaceae bacterium]